MIGVGCAWNGTNGGVTRALSDKSGKQCLQERSLHTA